MQFLVSLVTIIFGAFFTGVDGFNGNVLGYTAYEISRHLLFYLPSD